MSLIKFSYSEYENEPRYWEVQDVTFSNVNLIVGKNSSGKTRLLFVINLLTRFLSGQLPVPYKPCKFSANIKLNNREFVYNIEWKNGVVNYELLTIDGEEKLNRYENGTGKIYYEKEGKFLEFKLPPNVVAAVNRRDEIQHTFLIELYQWAKNEAVYLFGSDFGKSNLMGLNEAHSFNNDNPPMFYDSDDLIRVYSSALSQFGESFKNVIISDMNTLDYSLTEIGIGTTDFPFRAIGLFTVEKDLGFQNFQIQMSQGMFRALALVIHLNICAFSNSKPLILVDDIGEGLDYERATAMINLLIDKAKKNDMQLIMTSNDRFVMNEVPLDYWSVLKRKGGIVKLFNARNSSKQFNKFKYLGLNNFDFFASDFVDTEITND